MATQGKKPGGGMTVAEAGRMGGKLVSEKYGAEFYERIGKKGGSSTAERYGPEFFGRIGRKGGKAVTAKYGPQHFEKIGRNGEVLDPCAGWTWNQHGHYDSHIPEVFPKITFSTTKVGAVG